MLIRTLLPNERKYTYSQSAQLRSQTGSIGYLRGDFGSTGARFYSSWFDICPLLKTDAFRAEFDEVINSLRESGMLLENRSGIGRFAKEYPDSAFQVNGRTEYGFRVDTEKYAYLFRCNTTQGDYNFYCWCFVQEWLDRHIKKAEQNIRFIDSGYMELFRLPDGGNIIISYSDGEQVNRTCRFIDEYHTEIGNSLYHICEFAERMERIGATYAPCKE